MAHFSGDSTNPSGFAAFGGEWEDWCDSPTGQDRYGVDPDGRPYTWVCKREFASGGLIPFPPWTEAGQFLRWEAVGLIPESWEYDPEYLWHLQYNNPRRFAHLVLMASLIPGIAIPAAGIVGAAGPAYMTPLGFGILAYDRAYQRAFREYVDNVFTEYGEDRTWLATKSLGGKPLPTWLLQDPKPEAYADYVVYVTMWKPVIADMLKALGRIATYGVWTGIFLQGMEKESLNEHNPPMMRAVCAAIADSPQLFGFIIAGPISFTQAGFYEALSAAFKRFGEMIRSFDRNFADILVSIADSIYAFARVLAKLFQIPENPAALGEAADLTFEVAFGRTFTAYQQEVSAGVANVQNLAATRNADAVATLKALGAGITEISKGLDGAGLGILGEGLKDVLAPLSEVTYMIEDTDQAITENNDRIAMSASLRQSLELVAADAPPEYFTSTAPIATPTMPITFDRSQLLIDAISPAPVVDSAPPIQFPPGGIVTPVLPGPVDSQIPPMEAEKPKSAFGPILVGAGTGFAAGGPVGAGVGAGIVFALMKLGKAG